MAQVTRRGLLVAGGLALGAAAASSPPAGARAAGAGPALQHARLARIGDPEPFSTIPALATGSVMQDVVFVPTTRTFFITQAVDGSNGTSSPYQTTVISRVRYADGALLDSMQVIDGGHGLGFDVEMQGGRAWIWMTWHGNSAGSGEYDFVRFRYAPGRWRRAAANAELDLRRLPLQDPPEAVYHFDQAKDWAVERHFNWPQGSNPPSETFKRRRFSDLRTGADRTFGEITLLASPPTTQGFATIGGSLFRWLGAATRKDVVDRGNPVRLEQYDWGTGRRVGVRDYSGISRGSTGGWRDGVFEPEGMSVYRESDGTASLIVGDSTGAAGNREYHISRFADIGAE